MRLFLVERGDITSPLSFKKEERFEQLVRAR
jgi:hypothetical protein